MSIYNLFCSVSIFVDIKSPCLYNRNIKSEGAGPMANCMNSSYRPDCTSCCGPSSYAVLNTLVRIALCAVCTFVLAGLISVAVVSVAVVSVIISVVIVVVVAEKETGPGRITV